MLETYVSGLETIKWNYFATFTTPYELTLKSARRLMVKFHKAMKIPGREDWMFWVAEKYKLKDGYHLHALIKTSAPWDAESLWLLYQDKSVYNGQKSNRKDGKVYNRCDIRKRDPKKSAVEYMLKDVRYVTKYMGRFDYDIFT